MRIEKPSMIKLSDEDKKVLNKMGRYQPDGMSSEDGWNKFLSIQAHYGFQVVKHQASKEKFNRNFWLYYDDEKSRLFFSPIEWRTARQIRRTRWNTRP